MEAIVPGTVLTSLVENGVYPEPYYGTNNKISEKKIPDIIDTGREFWTYWFRTEFDSPALKEGERVWLHPQGINYRAEWWLNGHLVSVMAGMFNDDLIDITDFVSKDGHNALAALVKPVDIPGTSMPKPWGAPGENRNGGDGDIGWNTTQLMTVGWDFSYDDGKITFADYSAFIVSINLFLGPVNTLIRFMEQYQSGVAGFERFVEVLDMKPEMDRDGAKDVPRLKGEIEFDDVTFAYDGEHDVLKNISMKIKMIH